MLNNYSRVRLLADNFEPEGVFRDDLDYITEVYADNRCEVEFSDANGITYAHIIARSEHLLLSKPVLAEPALTYPF